MISNKYSYTAAGIFPAKLLIHQKLNDYTRKFGKIFPIHIQLNPTNRCNFNCFFCSCAGRKRNIELSYNEIYDIMTKSKQVGAESVTITGGGEPLMHRKIQEIILSIDLLGIQIGLVTNGTLLKNLSTETLDKIVWCRISSGDNVEYSKYGMGNEKYRDMLEEIVNRSNKTDWAFSHVLSRDPNYYTLEHVVKFANKHNFTHVRIVSDLLDLKYVPNMKIIKEHLRKRNIDDSKVFYQGRKDFTRGKNPCYISILKPIVGADGWIYPCCGTQYALKNPSKDYEFSMRMCKATEIDKLYEEQKFFDGSVCARCYYQNYNWALGVMLSKIDHEKFV